MRARSVSLNTDVKGGAQPSVRSPPITKLSRCFQTTAAIAHLVRKARYTMPFGELSMSSLMHACATGNLREVLVCLDGLRADKQALALELEASDDWALSTPLHWAACMSYSLLPPEAFAPVIRLVTRGRKTYFA